MFSDILKIIPKLEEKDLRAMQNALQSRFTKLAKGFGKGITNAFKGGGIAGMGLALIDKVLNPLKEVQEAIDRTLKTSDDIATNAAQFNTTSGKLFKLITLAKATGLDQDNLFMLINKYQTAVAQARQNPKDETVSSVRNFVGQEDTAEGFFNFITALRQMNKDQQLLVQQQIFGEKQILKMADFLQTDLTKLASVTGIDRVTSERAGRAVDKNAANNDLADALGAGRDFRDIIAKSGVINESMIRTRNKAEEQALEKENKRIQSYNDLQAISMTAEKIYGLVDQGIAMLGKLISTLTPMADKLVLAIDRLMKSPMIRGVKSLFGGKDE